MNETGSNGNWWSFAPNSQTNARNLNFNSGNVNPLNNNNRANGFGVWAALELMILFMVYSLKDIHYLVTTAYLKAREHERDTIAQLDFEMDMETEIKTISLELYHKTWTPQPLDWFVHTDRVVREIFAPQFRDRVVSHVLFNLLYPIFDKHFIYDSCSCRENKGTLLGIKRLKHHIRSVTDNYKKKAYCLNFDITGYFMSIDRMKLYNIVWKTLGKYKKKYPDELDYNFIDYLLRTLLFRDPLKGCIYHGDPKKIKLVLPEKSLRYQQSGIGIPIGDVVNQLFSNIYLDVFDHFVKRELKIKHYVRYVDDGKMLHESKEYLIECKERAKEFLATELGLKLHPMKTKVIELSGDIYFLGGVLRPYRAHMRNEIRTKFREYLEDLSEMLETEEDVNIELELSKLNSRLGYLQNFNDLRFVVRALIHNSLILKYFNFSRNLTKAIIKKS